MNAPERAVGRPLLVAAAPLAEGIGQSVPRRGARRLLEGASNYVDDLRLPRLCHVAFLRSPYAHCRIQSIDTAAAHSMPGVLGVFTGADLSAVVKPWRGVLSNFEGMRSGEQWPLAIDTARWQGEAIVAVVAETRALAEDALASIALDLEDLPPVTGIEQARAFPPIHADLPDNLCFTREIVAGDPDAAFAKAAVVVQQELRFGRQTGLPLEGRSVLADFKRATRELTIHHAHQAPHMVRDTVADLLGLPDNSVRVVCGDVGGSFGLKVHIYPDEIATIAIATLLGRPVKFVADRLESFSSDIHAREHTVRARMGFAPDGRILAVELDDQAAAGAYSMYPRTSAMEGSQVINFCAGAYRHEAYRASLKVWFQHKPPTSQYRAVGHPIACAVTESLIDEGARRLGVDPLALRRLNVVADNAYPYTSPAGMRFEAQSHQRCLDEIARLMDYQALRQEQLQQRGAGRHRGIGLAVMIELTNPDSSVYGAGGARISSQDGAVARLEPSGRITLHVSVGEQGQGTETVFRQIASEILGVGCDDVAVYTGDTQTVPMGGGTWGSRGAGIGGETVLQCCRQLRRQLCAAAAALLGCRASDIDLERGRFVRQNPMGGEISLRELAETAFYRSDRFPSSFQPELVAARHFTPKGYPITFTNGVQASSVEVDVDTGFVTLLKHWVVEDCGTVINPLLADEQIRGGVVQGIGSALYEECLYDEQGQLLNATMADYLVPMAGEMPKIHVNHVCTPTRTSELGAKGVGEAGTCGAPAAILNAVNDALLPFGARVDSLPITPQKVLQALGRIA